MLLIHRVLSFQIFQNAHNFPIISPHHWGRLSLAHWNHLDLYLHTPEPALQRRYFGLYGITRIDLIHIHINANSRNSFFAVHSPPFVSMISSHSATSQYHQILTYLPLHPITSNLPTLVSHLQTALSWSMKDYFCAFHSTSSVPLISTQFNHSSTLFKYSLEVVVYIQSCFHPLIIVEVPDGALETSLVFTK